MTPKPDGQTSKVKVKVRVNLHGIFNVSSAVLVEQVEKNAEEEKIGESMQVDNQENSEGDGKASADEPEKMEEDPHKPNADEVVS